MSIRISGLVLAVSLFASGNVVAFTTSLTTFTGDPAQVDIEATQSGSDIVITLNVVPFGVDGNIGDLRGFWFDVADEGLLPGLSVVGSDVTDQVFSANNVQNLSGGATISPAGPFDAGVELGTPGISTDDIQFSTFTISHSAAALDVNTFFRSASGGSSDWVVAARLTSVGPLGGDRSGSSKTAGVTPGGGDPTVSAPEPASLILLLLGALAVVAGKRGIFQRGRPTAFA